MIERLDKPIFTFFVIDVSGSMSSDDYPPTRVGAAGDASLAFLRESAARGGADHQAGVVTFNTRGRLALPPTDIRRIGAFESVFDELDGDGGTDFSAGLREVRAALDCGGGAGLMGRLLAKVKPAAVDPSVVRHVVFLSDGHSFAKSSAKSTAKELREAGVILETVGIGGSPEDVDERLLKAMASKDEQGEPRYRFIGDRQALLVEFKAKAARLKVC